MWHLMITSVKDGEVVVYRSRNQGTGELNGLLDLAKRMNSNVSPNGRYFVVDDEEFKAYWSKIIRARGQRGQTVRPCSL